MRTLYTSLALFSLVLVAFVATAAPSTPTLDAGCTACLSGPITLTASGINTHKSYGVTGYLNGSLTADFADMMTPQPDGTFTFATDLFPGDWVFTLSVLDHTADPTNPQKDILSINVTVN
jgi:hypothetical protein